MFRALDGCRGGVRFACRRTRTRAGPARVHGSGGPHPGPASDSTAASHGNVGPWPGTVTAIRWSGWPQSLHPAPAAASARVRQQDLGRPDAGAGAHSVEGRARAEPRPGIESGPGSLRVSQASGHLPPRQSPPRRRRRTVGA